METTEKIVESYCRYVKQWFTIPNIKCEGQYEVDLLAVDTTSPNKLGRYHIECGVSISGSYSKLTAKPFSTEQLRIRVQQAGQAPDHRLLYRAQVRAGPSTGGTQEVRFCSGKLSADHCHLGRDGRRGSLSRRKTTSCFGISENLCRRLLTRTATIRRISQMILRGRFSFSQWPLTAGSRRRAN